MELRRTSFLCSASDAARLPHVNQIHGEIDSAAHLTTLEQRTSTFPQQFCRLFALGVVGEVAVDGESGSRTTTRRSDQPSCCSANFLVSAVVVASCEELEELSQGG